MIKNLKHWYDGWFYDKFIAPNQDTAYKVVRNLIKENSAVLDAGCGTGRFAFYIKDKCKKVDGIDLSLKNILVARNKLTEQPSLKVNFYHTGVIKFLSEQKSGYDYALLSYVIHEIDKTERIEVLKALSDSSDYLILVDYLVPRPYGFTNSLNSVVEFAAGKEHYNNFKSFVRDHGLYGLVKESGLKIIKEIKNVPYTAHIIEATKY